MGFLFDKLQMLLFTVFLAGVVLFDSQIFLPKDYFHDSLIEFKMTYLDIFKDPFFSQDPPEWSKALVAFFMATSIPYYLMAIVAFAKGNCACIRTPTIMFTTSMVTGVVPLLGYLCSLPFEGPGVHPETTEELYKLVLLYSIVAFYHFLLLVYFLKNSNYGSTPVATVTHAAKKAKKN